MNINIHIVATKKEGYWTITSPDVQGLIMGGHENLAQILEDLPTTVRTLIELNHSIDVGNISFTFESNDAGE